MPTGDRIDPLAQYNFLVEIDGDPEVPVGFQEVGGLMTETDIIEYRNGDQTNSVTKQPGLQKFGPITLKRGWTSSDALWLWRKTTLDGVTERRSGSIVLLNEARQPQLRWNFREGWISKWEGPALNSTANEVAIESIEICVEYIELEVVA